jgi:soluble lytic murein transglycosylase-like protein
MHPLLLSALIQIESNGNDHARGRHGELGALQIRPIMVRDVNRIMGTHYAHQQVTNRATSIFIANAYLSHYGKHLSDESLARLWQGGPKGAKKSSTRAYARRVMRELDRQRTVRGESMTVQFTENPTTFTAR